MMNNESLLLLCFIYHHINFWNRYRIQFNNALIEIIEKNLDSISDPFECEYFKVKKIEIIEKMTRKSQASGSSGPSDGKFNNVNEYEDGNYRGDLPPN